MVPDTLMQDIHMLVLEKMGYTDITRISSYRPDKNKKLRADIGMNPDRYAPIEHVPHEWYMFGDGKSLMCAIRTPENQLYHAQVAMIRHAGESHESVRYLFHIGEVAVYVYTPLVKESSDE